MLIKGILKAQLGEEQLKSCHLYKGSVVFLKNNFIFDDAPYSVLFIFGCAGLHCYPQAFSSWRQQDYSLVAVCRFLIAMASLVVEHRLQSV